MQYADYTLWQRDLLGDESDPDSKIARQLAHWTESLAGLPETSRCPPTSRGPPMHSHRGAEVPFEIDAELHEAMQALARST